MREASRQRRKPQRSLEWKLDSRHKLQIGGLAVQTGLRDALGLGGDLEEPRQATPVRLFRGLCCFLIGALHGHQEAALRERFLAAGLAFEADWWREQNFASLAGKRRGPRRSPKEENRHKIQLGGLVIQTGLQSTFKLEGDLEKDPAQEGNVRLLRGAFSILAGRLSGEEKIAVATALMERGSTWEHAVSGGQVGQTATAGPFAVAAADVALLLGR